MTDFHRLIEHAFPLKQASLDSVHEKNVRHGHISTLHIWPARRPLAACRAALIATLLPDPSAEPKPPGMSDEAWQQELAKKRREFCEKIGGTVEKIVDKNGRVKEVTKRGVLHWHGKPKKKGDEAIIRQQAEDLEWFRQEIRKVYGRAPKVLDPFAGGGAIPLEAMRLGCEATAVDINPVAWFILKCTLEYPQKLAGQTRPLPEFILHNDEFMRSFFEKAKGYAKSEVSSAMKRLHKQLKKKTKDGKDAEPGLPFGPEEGDADELHADLAWHVRAWGQWVLAEARRKLAKYYPVYADFEPLKKGYRSYETRPMQLVPLKDNGTPDIDALNDEFSGEYLANKQNPRWVAKPTVAYLWARTVKCKNCRATVPLLKTRWLCKKDKKRVLLTMEVKDVEQASVPAADPGHRRKLPHLRRSGAAYFITWRLHRQQPDLEPGERSLVAQALKHFDGQRYQLFGWVVMNDHVHVVIQPEETHSLSQITHSWKSFTANRLQKLYGRQGAVWQDESWDRIIRDEEECLEKLEYIRMNPLKRWPQYEKEEYPWSGFDLEPKKAGTEACPTNKKVVFGIETNVPVKGGNAAQRREHDKRVGAGTMSRAGANCPCCSTIMTMEDIRVEGKAGKLGSVMTAVVVDSSPGKTYRLPTEHELTVALPDECHVEAAFEDVPFGLPDEPTPAGGGSGAGRAFSVQGYGLMKWRDLFTSRQLLALGTFVATTRKGRDEMSALRYPTEWIEAIGANLGLGVDKLADRLSAMCRWDQGYTKISSSFTRFALPMMWDYCEGNPFGDTTGNWSSCLQWIALTNEHIAAAASAVPAPIPTRQSATAQFSEQYDAVVTDPPYYDAIPYSDLMDFFYIWLRRSLFGLSPVVDASFTERLSPKWDSEKNDGELIDDSSRHGRDAAKSKRVYEDGMARVFRQCAEALKQQGRLVIVFANKQPDAWETLVTAIIRAGFVVDGSWPIQTEMGNRTRAHGAAALASSVWLVCKKRPIEARPGWDNAVLDDMRTNITIKLREFWDAGIRGPDFIWAATGPALEAYSKYPVVKKADLPAPGGQAGGGGVMSVSEFLNHVRRLVVDYIVGQVLSGGAVGQPSVAGRKEGLAGTEACPTLDQAAADRLDEPSAYYLLHRNDFGVDEAPVGAVILYATACGVSDRELMSTWDILAAGKRDSTGADAGATEDEGADPDEEAESEGDSGAKVKLKTWAQRKGKSMGYEAPGGKPVPLIDRIHRLMHLWKAGDVRKVDEYIDDNGLRRHELFKRVLQSLIELSQQGTDERSVLESISNHIGIRGVRADVDQSRFEFESTEVR